MAVTALALRQEGERNPALKDARVRQALNFAIDKGAIDKALLRGFGRQPAARGVTGYNPDVAPYPYDPAKAKALLVEAGYPDGFPLRFEVIVDRFPADRAIYETVAKSLAGIGVQVELRPVTPAAWMESYISGGWDRDTDGFLLTMNSGPYNDVARPLEIYSCLRPNGFTCDKEVTAKLIASDAEMDPDKRLAALNELARLYHDAAPAIYLNEQFDLYGISRKVEGFSLANRAPVYEKITVKN
jgi:peptide/nickel transport system substrate-binding protein